MPSRRRAAPGPCGAAPGEILITNWIDREGRFLPQDRRLWKAERESRALGTGSGNCLYVRVSNCSGIERIRTWEANVAGIKGRRWGVNLIIAEKWRQNLEARPGVGGRETARSWVGWLTFIPLFHRWLLASEQKRKVGIPSEVSGAWYKIDIGTCWSRSFSLKKKKIPDWKEK